MKQQTYLIHMQSHYYDDEGTNDVGEKYRFHKLFLDYGGMFKGDIKIINFRRSPILQGGFEIMIILYTMKSNAFDKMEIFVKKYHIGNKNDT